MSWPSIKLSEVCSILSGFAFQSGAFGEIGLPLIRIRDVVRGYTETKYHGEYEEKYIIENDDILIGMDGDFNLAKWKGGKALLNQRVCKLIPDITKIDSDYLYYFLPKKLLEIWKATPYVTVKHLSMKQINEILIPLPPLPVQKQIAKILEQADALREQCQQLEKELNALAQSVFLDMFGSIEANKKLGSFLSFITSGSRGWAEFYSSSGARFIRSLDVQMNHIGDDDIAYVNPPKGSEAERTKVKTGDVLLTITGSKIGRVCWVPDNIGEAYVSQHVAILRLGKEYIPEFISFYFSMADLGQRQIQKCQYGQTKPGLNLEQIKSFNIPDISIHDQKKFVDFMNKQKNSIRHSNEHNISADMLFNSLLQRAFRGQLNIQAVA